MRSDKPYVRLRLSNRERPLEKMWAAIKLLSQYEAKKADLGDSKCWVSIDQVCEFLVKRQHDADRVGFKESDPNTRYAIEQSILYEKGWRDMAVVHALHKCVDKGLIQHLRREDGNFFTYVPLREQKPWKINNDDTPDLPEWREKHVQRDNN